MRLAFWTYHVAFPGCVFSCLSGGPSDGSWIAVSTPTFRQLFLLWHHVKERLGRQHSEVVSESWRGEGLLFRLAVILYVSIKCIL